MGLVPMESQIKPGLSKKQMRIHVISWRSSQKKINTQMVGYLTRGAHTTCAQKGSGSILTSLMMEALSWWETTPCETVSIGNIRVRIFDGHVRTLTNVQHVPDLKNLLLLGALKARGYKFSGADGVIKITKGSMTILKGEQTTNLYKLTGNIIISDASAATEDTTRLWHMCLRHMSERGLQALHKSSALPGIKYCKLDLCKFCIMGRQRRVAFFTSQHKTKSLLDLIHTDVWGPSPVASIGGARYYITFINDFSRKDWVYFLKQKSKVFQKFKEWKTLVKNQTGRKVKVLKLDNRGEYTSKEFKNYLASKGIKH